MSLRVAGATAARVLAQLRRDPRTIALLVAVPCALEALLKEVFRDRSNVFQHIGVPLLGLFPFISMFLVTSITMLRERTSGTLERLMTMPLGKLDLLLGYGAAFAAVAALQAAAVSALAFGALGLHSARSTGVSIVLAVANAVLGMSLGLFVSAFARTEFQAVQFMPAFIFPQLLLCGLIVERSQMARPLEIASYALPLTYAYDALARVARPQALGGRFALDVGVIAGATLLALLLGAATLRRRTT
jgi:ABC-2 type transport system permease protein